MRYIFPKKMKYLNKLKYLLKDAYKKIKLKDIISIRFYNIIF